MNYVKTFTCFGFGMLIFIVDRLTKNLALMWCGGVSDEFFLYAGKALALPASFTISCHVTMNRGVSWGLFDSENMFVFSIVSLVIMCITAFFTYHAYARYVSGHLIVGEICVIAGSCSNIFDRFYYQGVVDFIVITCGNLSFPIFNVADIAIVAGITFILIQHYRE